MTRSEQRRKLIKAVNRNISDLTSFDRDYLILYLTENNILNESDIAKILGMTRANVNRIIQKEKFYQVVPSLSDTEV